MAGTKRHTVRDAELLTMVLDRMNRTECLTSDLYDISNPARIESLLGKLSASDLIKYRIKEEGQKRPLYSLTRRGVIFSKLNKVNNMYLNGEIRDDPRIDEILEELLSIIDNDTEE
jgi:DNA-binding PadR family transcriptional regulator